MKRFLPLILCLLLFVALLVNSPRAAEGARQGLELCLQSLAPSLFPFFVLSRLLMDLGLTELLGRSLGPLMQKLLGLSPAGAGAFLLGLSGGYPLGAAAVADLRRREQLSRDEAERLLAFCNNSGPAFIIGGAGAVFQSPAAGALLYLAHVLAAMVTGLIFRRKGQSSPPPPDKETLRPFPTAFPAAVRSAAVSTMNVCAFVCFFRAMLALTGDLGFLPELWRIPATGLLELGSGIAALRGFPPKPVFMAMAGFMLGFGGLSVHCQTLGAVAGTDIKCARHLAGRALCGVIAAMFSFLFAYRI